MKHNSNKTALIAFSSTLAVLVIVTLVCTALFAGASDEAEPANSVVNNNVVYVGFDKEPTEGGHFRCSCRMGSQKGSGKCWDTK